MVSSEGPTRTPPWSPPIWLRKLRTVADEQRHAPAPSISFTERFRVACELMAFAMQRLEEQATRRGCSVSALLAAYERVGDRLRARG